ncbi:MAG: dihydrolipoyl dehydrogenase [Candidatus Sericytochromatia bacterium]|nr:dihydrolipoyl dehydrogenase [Candidatus Sericytochromatia bacterium]
METKKYDAVVVGAGPGGYACGIRMGQLGLKTLVIEQGTVGGVCLNVGCIPSKALIQGAKTFEKTKKGATMGIVVESVHLDFPKLQGWKDGIIKKLTGGVSSLLKGNKVDVLAGRAELQGPRLIQVDTGTERVVVEAAHIVLATGSRPIEIPGFAFGGPIMSSTEALSLAEVPEKLVVIGGGYIGLELGQAYAKMGALVTVVEASQQLLPGQDPDLTAVVAKKLTQSGVKVLTEAKAQSWEPLAAGARVQIEVGGQVQWLEADKVLVTVGRRPNSENLGLERLGVHVERGFVSVNNKMQTNVPGVYAIGDLVGQPMLAHKASMEAEIVAEVIAGHAAEWDGQWIPAVIFTDPEIANVGLTPAQAAAEGRKVLVGKFPFAASGRAMTTGETEGFVKALVDADTLQLLGVGIVGPQASDLIAEAALALEMGAFKDDIALTVHAHPTLAETFMEAVKHAVGEAIHTLNQAPVSPRH